MSNSQYMSYQDYLDKEEISVKNKQKRKKIVKAVLIIAIAIFIIIVGYKHFNNKFVLQKEDDSFSFLKNLVYELSVDTIYSDIGYIQADLFPPNGSGWMSIQSDYPKADTVCLLYRSEAYFPSLGEIFPFKIAFVFTDSDRPESFSIQLPVNISNLPVNIRFFKNDYARQRENFSIICGNSTAYMVPLSYVYKSEEEYCSKIFILGNNLIIPGCKSNAYIDFFKLFLENQYLVLEWLDINEEILNMMIFLTPFVDGEYKYLISASCIITKK